MKDCNTDSLKLKVCVNDHCDAVFHNIPKKVTRCLDCGGILVAINQDTYLKKFRLNWFQYDYQTGEYVHEPIKDFQPTLFEL